ncbi:MAG: transposase [Candidatus Scalindua sp.]
MQYIQSISGVEFIMDITFLGKIDNPKHLKNVRELSTFTGLVLAEFSTGDPTGIPRKTYNYGSSLLYCQKKR